MFMFISRCASPCAVPEQHLSQPWPVAASVVIRLQLRSCLKRALALVVLGRACLRLLGWFPPRCLRALWNGNVPCLVILMHGELLDVLQPQSETEDMLFIDSASGEAADDKAKRCDADVRPSTSVLSNFAR